MRRRRQEKSLPAPNWTWPIFALAIVGIKAVNESIVMRSIRRDVYVARPGQSTMQRINSIYAAGELQEPGGVPKLLMQAMRYNFGMPVNSYVGVSFDAAINLVDDIGGVDI